MGLHGVGVVAEPGQVVGVGVGRAPVAVGVHVLLDLFDVLRLGVQLLGHLAQQRRRQRVGVLDDALVLLRLGPLAVGAVGLGQLAQLLDRLLALVHLLERLD